MGKLEENLRLLETTRACTLSMVRRLSQAQMDRAPAGGGWSIGEVLDHLLRSEAIYRNEISELVGLARAGKTPFIARGVKDIDFSPWFLPKSMLPLVDIPFTVATMFVPQVMRDLMIRYSSVLKGQSPARAVPAKGRAAAELVAALEKSLADTGALLNANPGLDWDNMRIHHPLLGLNSVPQMLRLTALHERRHQDQLRRLLAGVSAAAQAA